MFKLAMRTLRLRKGGFLATFVAVFFGALIVSACGGLMETGILSATPVQRLAAAPIVVTGKQDFERPKEDPAEDEKHRTKTATLPERVRLDAALTDRLSTIPGVISTGTHFRLKAYKENGALLHRDAPSERLAVAP